MEQQTTLAIQKSQILYDEILTKSPVNLSPYLTRRGLGILCVGIGFGVLSAVFMVTGIGQITLFGAAIISTVILVLAMIHGYLLIVWRAVYLKEIGFEVSIKAEHLYPGSEFDIHYQIHNRLKFPVLIEAMRWDCSPQIQVIDSSDKTWMLAGKSQMDACVQAKAVAVGNAAIFGYGVILTDPLNLLRAEIHTEVGYETEIKPARTVSGASNLNLLPILNRKLFWKSRMAYMTEPDCIRAYQHGDLIKRILWRGYARRQELTVWQPQKLPPEKLVCFIDAGPRMRLGTSRNPLAYQIVDVVTQIASCAGRFDTVTVIAYHESGAEIVVREQPPEVALNALDNWCLKMLSWKIPDFKSQVDKERWRVAVHRVWKCYKLYKGVDFSHITKNIRKIDLKKLAEWARVDLMYRAIRENNDATTKQLSTMPVHTLIGTIIQYWCRTPENRLPPQLVTPMVEPGMDLLKSVIQQDGVSGLIWFSDFSDEFSQKSLNFVIQLLSGSGIEAIGVVMKMPVHQLNFIAKLGAVCQARNYQKLSEVMAFVWMDNPNPHIKK